MKENNLKKLEKIIADLSSINTIEKNELKKVKLNPRSRDIKEGLYNSMMAVDAYKDAFYNNPSDFIKYVIERNDESDIATLFGFLRAFAKSGSELWMKQREEKRKSKDGNNVLTKETYTIDELSLLLLKSRSAINAYFKLSSPLVKSLSNSKPVIKRNDLITFLNNNPSIKILNPTMDKEKFKEKEKKKIVAKRNLR